MHTSTKGRSTDPCRPTFLSARQCSLSSIYLQCLLDGLLCPSSNLQESGAMRRTVLSRALSDVDDVLQELFGARLE